MVEMVAGAESVGGRGRGGRGRISRGGEGGRGVQRAPRGSFKASAAHASSCLSLVWLPPIPTLVSHSLLPPRTFSFADARRIHSLAMPTLSVHLQCNYVSSRCRPRRQSIQEPQVLVHERSSAVQQYSSSTDKYRTTEVFPAQVDSHEHIGTPKRVSQSNYTPGTYMLFIDEM